MNLLETEGHGVQGLGGVPGEDELGGIAPVEEPAEGLAGLVHADGDLVGQVVDAAAAA